MNERATPEQLALFGKVGTTVALAEHLGVADLEGLQAHELGSLHERALGEAGDRKRGGSYYTPPDVVDKLLDLTLDPILEDRAREGVAAVSRVRILDPACGSGNFLAAAAARITKTLHALGVDAHEAAATAHGECVIGIDIDTKAVELCRAALVHSAGGAVAPGSPQNLIFCADALAIEPDSASLFSADAPTWKDVLVSADCVDGFDLVIGNPPFLSQLAAETVRSEAYTGRLRRRFGAAVAGLTDTALLFLLLGAEVARRGGVVCLIQPISVLSTRDGGAVRSGLLENCGLRSLWVSEEQIFDAAVRVCVPVLVKGGKFEQTILHRSRGVTVAGSVPSPTLADSSWAGLLASAKGIPDRSLECAGTLRDLVTATADFRDQYYGLRGSVVDRAVADAGAFPPLVTSGLLDPANILWGVRGTRFDKAKFEHPRVDLARLNPELQAWAKERLVPKVLLATQTRVLEAAVDEPGEWLPSVPVISITAVDVGTLWKVGALLTSPPVTLIAARRHLGAALSTDALKLGARDVLELPMPAGSADWSAAAGEFERASRSQNDSDRRQLLVRSAELMCAAFGVPNDEELLSWWLGRMPRNRGNS